MAWEPRTDSAASGQGFVHLDTLKSMTKVQMLSASRTKQLHGPKRSGEIVPPLERLKINI